MSGRHREPEPNQGPPRTWQADGEHTGPVAMPPRDPATAPQPVPQWAPGPPGYGGYSQRGPVPPRSAHPGRPQAPAPQPPAPQPPAPQPPRRAPAPPPQRPRQGERKEAVAFVLHQFPIGYLPIAAASASHQLPLPADDPRGRPPLDHPRADLVDDAAALARARSADLAAEDSPGVEPPDGFTAGHDPLAGRTELEWDHEFREPGAPDSYRWPPPESRPEPEPVVLEPDTVVDALGTGAGRLCHPDGTPFTERSLPPEHLELPYHRYRVLRPLPVWRSTAVPWFGARGGGVVYRTTHPLAELAALGLLAELTPERMAAEAGTIRLDRAEIDRLDRGGTARLRTDDDRPQPTEEIST